MEFLAHLYVDQIEPALKIGALLIMVVVVFQVFMAIRDPKKRGELLSVVFKSLIAFVVNTVKAIGKGVVLVVVVLHKIVREVYKVISDFFTSKI